MFLFRSSLRLIVTNLWASQACYWSIREMTKSLEIILRSAYKVYWTVAIAGWNHHHFHHHHHQLHPHQQQQKQAWNGVDYPGLGWWPPIVHPPPTGLAVTTLQLEPGKSLEIFQFHVVKIRNISQYFCCQWHGHIWLLEFLVTKVTKLF